MIEITDILLCIAAGLFAGVLNTIAGSGSVVTLSLLSFLELPANIANGTNRIGLLFQSSASSLKFYRQGDLNLHNKWFLLLSILLGTIGGVYVASILDVAVFEKIIGAVFLVLFFVVLLKPQRYLKESKILLKLLPLIFLFIGFYAGFIQAGAGVFMLAIMHAVWGKSFTELNPLKVFIILCINCIALIGYSLAGQVNWGFGLALAIGQVFGGLIGVRLNNLKNNIEPVLRLLLLVLILASVAKFWNLY